MDYAYALALSNTGVDVAEWLNMPLIELFEWGRVVSERQKQIENEIKKKGKR